MTPRGAGVAALRGRQCLARLRRHRVHDVRRRPGALLQDATRLEFAGGLSAKILPGLTLYAQAGYQFAVSGTDGGTRDGVSGDLGVHYAW